MNLLLQYWDSRHLPDWLKLSSKTVKDYAQYCGAEYKLIHGMPFHEGLPVTAQKLCILNEDYDVYDRVIIVDADMIAVKDPINNAFDCKAQFKYIKPKTKNKSSDTELLDYKYPMPHGMYYSFSLEERQLLRQHFNFKLFIDKAQNHHSDEHIMNYLVKQSNLRIINDEDTSIRSIPVFQNHRMFSGTFPRDKSPENVFWHIPKEKILSVMLASGYSPEYIKEAIDENSDLSLNFIMETTNGNI